VDKSRSILEPPFYTGGKGKRDSGGGEKGGGKNQPSSRKEEGIILKNKRRRGDIKGGKRKRIYGLNSYTMEGEREEVKHKEERGLTKSLNKQ